MSLFAARTLWSQSLGQTYDIDSLHVTNILRTKTGGAQIVTGSLEGLLFVHKPTTDGAPDIPLVAVQTDAAILAVLSGFFTVPCALPNPADPRPETPEVAVIHPAAVALYAPKRAAAGDVTLECIATIPLPSHVGSAAVATQMKPTTDASGKSRLQMTSYLLVKTLDGFLHVITRTIQRSVNLGAMHALPGPVCFLPGPGIVAVSTAEYDVVGISLDSLLQDENAGAGAGADWPAGGASHLDTVLSAGHARGSATNGSLDIRWTFTAGDRVQGLCAGRFFGADSDVSGELMLLLPRAVLWIDATAGTLISEQRFPECPLLCAAPVYAPVDAAKASRRIKATRVASVILLDGHGGVYLLHKGAIQWRCALGSVSAGGGRVVALASPTSFGVQFTSSLSPPLLAEAHGLFVTLTADGRVACCCLGTRPLLGGAGPTLHTTLSPLEVQSQGVTKALAADLREELAAIRRAKAESSVLRGDSLRLACRVTDIKMESVQGASILFTYLAVTLATSSDYRFYYNTLCCIHPARGSAEDTAAPQAPPARLVVSSPGALAGDTAVSVDNSAVFIRELLEDSSLQLTVKVGIAAGETLRMLGTTLGIFGYAVNSAASTGAAPAADAAGSAAADAREAMVPYTRSVHLTLPFFSANQITPSPATLPDPEMLARKSPGQIVLSLTVHEERGGQDSPGGRGDISSLVAFLRAKAFSARALQRIDEQSPNSVRFVAADGAGAVLSLDALNTLTLRAPYDALGMVWPALEFLLSYETLCVDAVACDDAAVAAAFAQCTARVADLGARIAAGQGRLAKGLGQFFELFERVNKDVCNNGSVSFALDAASLETFDRARCRIPSSRNVGLQVDAMCGYLGALLADTQACELRRAGVQEALRGATASLTAVALLLRARGAGSAFDRRAFFQHTRALGPLLSNFDTPEHLYYMLLSLCKAEYSVASDLSVKPEEYAAAARQFLGQCRDGSLDFADYVRG